MAQKNAILFTPITTHHTYYITSTVTSTQLQLTSTPLNIALDLMMWVNINWRDYAYRHIAGLLNLVLNSPSIMHIATTGKRIKNAVQVSSFVRAHCRSSFHWCFFNRCVSAPLAYTSCVLDLIRVSRLLIWISKRISLFWLWCSEG